MKAKRFEALEKLNSHPWYCRTMPKLKKDGLDFCKKFIEEMGDANPDVWMHHVNRLFLGQTAPKYADVAQEILCVVGTSTDPRQLKRRG